MIVFCKDCNNRMSLIYHFEERKTTSYYQCKKCFYTTKPKAFDVDKAFRNDDEKKVKPQISNRSTVIKTNDRNKRNNYKPCKPNKK